MNDLCMICKQPIGNDVFTVCDDCWDIKDDKVKERVVKSSDKLLRDNFAGQALQGSLVNPKIKPMTAKELAEKCYDFADAMMEAREK